MEELYRNKVVNVYCGFISFLIIVRNYDNAFTQMNVINKES